MAFAYSISSADVTNELQRIWSTWNVATSTALSNQVWQTWVTGTGSSSMTMFSDMTPEQRAAREALAAEARRIAEQANVRAHALLVSVLTEGQQRELEEHRYFTVESRTSKRRYRVDVQGERRHGNIREIDSEGNSIASWCAAPEGDVPFHDAIAGQKLFLEHDEETFRRTANRTPREAVA